MSEAPKNRKDPTTLDWTLEKVFLASDVLPHVADTLLTPVKGIEEAIKTSDIVLDTNVLLLPFGAGASSLKQIVEVYSKLSKEKRLFVPAQVLREFIRHRPNKIAELYQGLNDKISRFSALEALSYPILEGIDEYKFLNETIAKSVSLKAELNKATNALLKNIRSWEWNDPVSKSYKEVFSKDRIFEPSYERNATLTELRRRYDLSIPPGYKDSAKEDLGIGDLLIWKTMLEIGRKNKKDMIFVTGEEKADWQHRAGSAGFLPRYELLDEYRRSSVGRAFYIIPLSKLLELLQVESKSVEEIKLEEKRIQVASAVTVTCPYCEFPMEWRLAEAIGSSSLPRCLTCENNFHIHRTRDGVLVRKTNLRSSQTRENLNMSIEGIPLSDLAKELGLPDRLLIEQFALAGISGLEPASVLTAQDKTRLVEYLRLAHGARAGKE